MARTGTAPSSSCQPRFDHIDHDSLIERIICGESRRDAHPRGTEQVGQLLIDAAGDIYGTTSAGGASGDGTVFKIAAKSQTFTVLHSFSGTDGSGPMAELVSDPAGDLFGTTATGGANSFGPGFDLAGGGFRTGDRR